MSIRERQRTFRSSPKITYLSHITIDRRLVGRAGDQTARGTLMSTDAHERFETAVNRIDEFKRRGERTYLTLNGLALGEIPMWLFEVGRDRLQRLDLRGNNLGELPAAIGSLSHLRELDVSRNALVKLPPEIGLLSNLRVLNASDNRIVSIPTEVGQLSSLEELYLLRNRLHELPIEIGKLINLRELYIWGNDLNEIPGEIGSLQNLTILNLSVNQLSSLPRELLGLTRLRELYLHHNPALRLPEEILGASSASTHFHKKRDEAARPADPARILKYHFAAQRHPLLEARVIIVGDGGVGKSSLARQLVHSTPAQSEQPTTPGVAIETWPVALRGSQVQVHVWDFGGQEPMHAAHPYFFTERCLYLVVASSRESGVEERLDYWLTTVEKVGAGARALAVVNKVDQNAMDIDRATLGRKHVILPRDSTAAFFPTACTTGEGMAALRAAVMTQLEFMEQIWDFIPSSFFAVKTHLQSLRAAQANVVSFDRWRDICRESGVDGEDERRDLLELLRNLGSVISFPDDARLRHLGVLNPEWVVRAIYPLLSSDEIAAAGGLLTEQDIERILPNDSYPMETHGWLISLMEAFELIFPVDARRYLVPSRLPKEAPEWSLSEEWCENRDALHLELRYDVLPDNVISRFVVRNHSRSHTARSWWRYGIAIRSGPCRALVRALPGERKIEVRVRGPRIHRPSFIYGIRRDLQVLTEHLGHEQLWVILLGDHAEKYDELLLLAEHGHTKIPRVIAGQYHEFELSTILDLIETKCDQRDHAQRLMTEVNLTMARDIYNNRDGILVTGRAKVGVINAKHSWTKLSSEGMAVEQLASQLDQLRLRAKERSTAPEHDVDVGKVTQAQAEARKGNGPGALKKLRGISKWLLELAKEIGVDVAAKAIEAACGLPGG
jgi:internalin A